MLTSLPCLFGILILKMCFMDSGVDADHTHKIRSTHSLHECYHNMGKNPIPHISFRISFEKMFGVIHRNQKLLLLFVGPE